MQHVPPPSPARMAKRLRRRSSGSVEGPDAVGGRLPEDLPLGPSSLKQCFEWPLDTWATFHPEEKARFAETFRMGVDLRTQYSGMGCVEQSFMLMQHMLTEKVPGIDNVAVKEQCDVSRLCRKVLLAFPSAHRAEHMNGDILSRLPKCVQRQLGKLVWPSRPPKTTSESSDAAAVEEYNQRMETWENEVQEVVDEARRILDCYDCMLFQPGFKAKCHRHDSMCPVWEPVDERSRFALNVTGTTCLDWTYMGSRLGLGGASALPFIVWLREQRKRRVAALLHECTPGFRPELLRSELPESEYDIQCVVMNPETAGVPNERERLFTLALRRDVYCLNRPFADFLSFARRRRMIDGSVYYVAPREIIDAEIDERAMALSIERSEGQGLSWHDVLGSGHKVRLEGYKQRACEMTMAQHVRSDLGIHSVLESGADEAIRRRVPFLFDLEHTPLGCPRMSTVAPCLLRHGELWNDLAGVKRGLCREEYLSIAGVWTLPAHGVGIPCAFEPLLKRGTAVSLSTADCKNLAGNCIHINVIGQMCMWIAAHLVVKGVASPWADAPLLVDYTADPEQVA